MRPYLFSLTGACILSFAVWTGGGCRMSDIPEDPAQRVLQEVQQREWDVAEAAFRHLFEENYTGAQHQTQVYFLLLDGTNPPSAFMERFENDPVPVKIRSRSDDGFMTEAVKDRDDPKKSGVIFAVDAITITGLKAVVKTRHYENPQSRSEIEYTLQKTAQGWTVTGKKIIRLI